MMVKQNSFYQFICMCALNVDFCSKCHFRSKFCDIPWLDDAYFLNEMLVLLQVIK